MKAFSKLLNNLNNIKKAFSKLFKNLNNIKQRNINCLFPRFCYITLGHMYDAFVSYPNGLFPSNFFNLL